MPVKQLLPAGNLTGVFLTEFGIASMQGDKGGVSRFSSSDDREQVISKWRHALFLIALNFK